MKRDRVLSRSAVAACACATLAALGGCGFHRDVGASDRCADIVAAALPGSVEITDRSAAVQEGVSVAAVQAKSSGIPGTVSAQCRFERDVLAGFRWTAGPGAPPASGSSVPPPGESAAPAPPAR